MNRCGRLGLSFTIAIAVGVASAVVSAQQPSADKDKARVLELVAYARATYDQAQKDAQAPPPGTPAAAKQDARPALQLTADDAVKHALDNNIDLAVEKLNPVLQDWSIR